MVSRDNKVHDEDDFEVDEIKSSGESVSDEGLNPASKDTFDISAFPAPPVNAISYAEFVKEHGLEDELEDTPDDEDDAVESSGVEEGDGVSPVVDALEPGWDVVFLPGEDPRMVVRATLDTDEPVLGEGALVEASALLGEDDVKRLLDLALKVERFHSAKYKFWRRLRDWAWRRKFFSGATIVVLLVLGISSVINALR